MQTSNIAAPQEQPVLLIPLAAISPPAPNYRKTFDDAEDRKLGESMAIHGQLQPVLVRPKGKGYELVFGERRFRGARLVGLPTIRAEVRDLDDKTVLELQLIENCKRADVHPLEEAEGYERLTKEHGYPIDELASKLCKSKAYIYARLKLLALSPELRKVYSAGDLTASTALLIAR